jgi:cell wall-associated NlpC family hydrolase
VRTSHVRSETTCAPAAQRTFGVARRLQLLACAAASAFALALPAGADAKYTAANWDVKEQQAVVLAGLMTEAPPAGFQGASPLSYAEDSDALGALSTKRELAPFAVTASAAPVTVRRFDALLVDQLGLSPVAEHVEQTAVAAGLKPPSYFGTEVVARYLGLRFNHPAGEDSLELYPWNPITRAEAAHSFAVALELTSWEIESARQTLETFSLPTYDAAQLEVLRIAVSKIGMPYVWAGTTDNTADGLEHGGYDCSGFAWRVYKVSGLPWGKQIHGRTAAEQAGEIPQSARLHLSEVQGGDLLFFGTAHFDSTATNADVTHEGIALSDEWAIHSSAQGVYVLPLTSGWLAESFAWARRVL